MHVFCTPLLEFIFSSEHMCVSNEMQDMLESYKLALTPAYILWLSLEYFYGIP